jgi:hypothetical protein
MVILSRGLSERCGFPSRVSLRSLVQRAVQGWFVLEVVNLIHQRKDYESDDDKVKSSLMEHPVIDDGTSCRPWLG